MRVTTSTAITVTTALREYMQISDSKVYSSVNSVSGRHLRNVIIEVLECTYPWQRFLIMKSPDCSLRLLNSRILNEATSCNTQQLQASQDVKLVVTRRMIRSPSDRERCKDRYHTNGATKEKSGFPTSNN